jgi:hypothetical protein
MRYKAANINTSQLYQDGINFLKLIDKNTHSLLLRLRIANLSIYLYIKKKIKRRFKVIKHEKTTNNYD